MARWRRTPSAPPRMSVFARVQAFTHYPIVTWDALDGVSLETTGGERYHARREENAFNELVHCDGARTTCTGKNAIRRSAAEAGTRKVRVSSGGVQRRRGSTAGGHPASGSASRIARLS